MRTRSLIQPLVLGLLTVVCGLGSGIAGAQPSVVATVSLGPEAHLPQGIAVNPGTNRIYVANYDSDNVSVIDGATNTTVATVSVGDAATAAEVDTRTNRVYVTAGEALAVIDGQTNELLTAIPFKGGRQGHCIAVSPTSNRVYVTNALDNTVSVIDGRRGAIINTVAVGEGPQGIDVNPTNGRVYVANVMGKSVSVIDARKNKRITDIPLGFLASDIAVNPETNRIYVSQIAGFSVIDGASNKVVTTVADGRPSMVLTANPTTNRVYVAEAARETVDVIDGESNTIVDTVDVGAQIADLAANPDTNRIYVANLDRDAVSVIEDPRVTKPIATPIATAAATLEPAITSAPTPGAVITGPSTGGGPGEHEAMREGVLVALGLGGALLVLANMAGYVLKRSR